MKLYQSEDLQVKLDVLVENETVWLSQKQMAILYGTAVPAISKHIKNIFESGELQAYSTVSKMEIVQQEGDNVLYTFEASLKDLGKKLFCFTLIESVDVVEVVRRLGAG